MSTTEMGSAVSVEPTTGSDNVDLSTSSLDPSVNPSPIAPITTSSHDNFSASNLAVGDVRDEALVTLISENQRLARIESLVASGHIDPFSVSLSTAPGQSQGTEQPTAAPRELTAEDRTEIMRTIENRAESLAARDHNTHPNQEPDSERMEKYLRETLEAAAQRGVPLSEEFVQSVVARMQARYEERRGELFSEMPWYKRGYYSVTSFCSSCWDGLKSVGDTIVKATQKVVKAVQDPEFRKSVVDGVKKAWDATVEYVTNPDKLLTDLGKAYTFTVNAIGDGLIAAKDYVVSGQILTDLASAGTYLYNQAVDGLSALYEAGKWVVNNPRAAFSALGSAALNFVQDPIGSIEKSVGMAWDALGNTAVGGFITSMSDSLGVTSLVRGTWNLTIGATGAAYAQLIKTAKSFGTDLASVLSGDLSVSQMFKNLGTNLLNVGGAYLSKMGEGLEAIKGGAVLFLEVSGLMDLGMMAYHGYKFVEAFANDDKAGMTEHALMFGLHTACAAMSIGSIAATISTAGAAGGTIAGAAMLRTGLKVAAKELLKTAAKGFLKTAAKEMGQEVVERLGKELATEVIEATAREIADKGGKELAERIVREGSSEVLTTQTRAVMADVSEELTEKMLRSANLVQHVDDVTTEMLEKIHTSSVKELTQELEAAGVKNASGTAKELKKLVKNGNADAEIKAILEEEITTAVREHLEANMEQAFKSQFRGMLDGSTREALEQAQRELLEKNGVESVEQLSKAARKEFDELGEQIKHCETLEKAAKEEAERLGKSLDEYIDEVVEDGWKGVKEGIEKAVRKLVREGIEQAFKRFRESARNYGPRIAAATPEFSVGEEVSAIEQSAPVEVTNKVVERTAQVVSADENRSQMRVEHSIGPDGRPVAKYFNFDPEINDWVLTGVEVGTSTVADEVVRTEVAGADSIVAGQVVEVTEAEATSPDLFSSNPEPVPVAEYSLQTAPEVVAATQLGFDPQEYIDRVSKLAETVSAEQSGSVRIEDALNLEGFERLVQRVADDLASPKNTA